MDVILTSRDMGVARVGLECMEARFSKAHFIIYIIL